MNCTSIFLHDFRIKMYEHENNWNKAVGSYDLEMAFNPSSPMQVGLVKVSDFTALL